ncbi:MAG: SRPBCC family protein [Streptosporangiales bacterium]|nr:SRPBCC family protein [Streptosporangiales bacterium]
MPRPYTSIVINAPADAVWSYLRDFGNLNEWIPAVKTSEIEGGGPADQIGCVRRLELQDGALIREALLALDDPERSYTYEFVESPFPVRSYRATIRVAPVTEGGQTFVEWWTWFDADAKDEEQLTTTFGRDVFAASLAALRKRFEG